MDIPAFIHDDYERISDDLMYLGYSVSQKCSYVLRFSVKLASVDKSGKRVPFHTEYRYETRKYTNQFAGNSIRRHIDYYMSIEGVGQADNTKDFIMIRARDMIYLRRQLEEVESWFMGRNPIYSYNNEGQLIIAGRPDPITIDGLSLNKYFIMSPIITDKDGVREPGLRVILDNSNTFDMSINNFYEFYYIISSIDMYNAASTMMAYFGRPEFGTNLWSPMDQSRLYESQQPEVEKIDMGGKGRKPKKSFFE